MTKICGGCDEEHEQKGKYCRDCEMEINAMLLREKEKKEREKKKVFQ